MDYRIITTAPVTTIETIQHEHLWPAQVTAAGAVAWWTHETSTAWAHTEGKHLPAGTRISIERRRGVAYYRTHRRYVVGEDGIVRRIGD